MENKLVEGLNSQINKELYSAYLYFGMSAYFFEINLSGFGKLLKKQAKEELKHAKKIYNYLIAKNEKISLQQIEAPETNWINPIDAIKGASEHEQFVTNSINELYSISREHKEYSTEIFLQWFITEQVEEEEKFRTLLEKMENSESCDCEIAHIDRNLEDDENVSE